MPILPRSSYYEKDYRQAAALIRARQPYLIKNIVTGSALFAFAMGIYVYTFKAVAQDDFSDIQIPDAPVQSAHTPNIGVDRAAAAPAVKKAPETR